MGQVGGSAKAQAAVLDSLTESKQFDKIKVSDKARDNKARVPVNWARQWQPCRYCGGVHQPKQCPVYGKMCAECRKVGHFRKVCCSRRSRVINNTEQEVSQTVSIISVYMTKNRLMLTVKLKMHAGNNKIQFHIK